MRLSLALLRRVKRLLRRYGASPDDAEDLVQEAVLRLHVYERAGNEIRSPESFVARTALNLAVDAVRRAHASLYEDTAVENLTIIDTQPRPDEVFDAEERLTIMRDTLDRVSLRTREVFFMHRLQGFSHAEIASRLGISKSTIEKHIASAVTILAMQRELE